MAIVLAGTVVGYKTKYQDTVAHSSTEAEFVAACETAKIVLFFRSILNDIGISQEAATVIYEDNRGALLLANAQQPTRHTRHMDIKYFALQDWVESDLILLKDISTSDRAADAFTKVLSTQSFHRHYDTYMGRRVPDYTGEAPFDI